MASRASSDFEIEHFSTCKGYTSRAIFLGISRDRPAYRPCSNRPVCGAVCGIRAASRQNGHAGGLHATWSSQRARDPSSRQELFFPIVLGPMRDVQRRLSKGLLANHLACMKAKASS
ncbi:hypothetical protein RB213_002635 [Colletotrichum asianum]